MKTFKGWIISEATAQKASKDFETYIANLAVLSEKETSSNELKKLISNNKNKFKGLKPKDLPQVIDAVSKLNNFFKVKWTKGVNANFETNLHKGIYGKKSEAKADIILTAGSKKYGISIKKRGDVVVASSQDPTEFENIFWTAFEKFKEDKSEIDELSKWTTVIAEAEGAVESIRDNVVGQLNSRILKPEWFNKLKVGKKKESPSEQKMREQFFVDMENTIKTQNKTVTEDYENMLNNIAKDAEKLIAEKLKNNVLKEYVIWEALSAMLKYEGKLPAATHILSPSGCYDISNPNTKFVKECAKASDINFRGMVQGLRSGKEPTMNPVLKKLFAGKTIDMAKLYDDVRTMKMSMKIDLKGKKRTEMETELDNPISVDEGFFSNIWDKMKGWWNSFKTTIQNGIELFKSKSNEVLDKMAELKQASFLDILKFNKPKISGTIRIP